MSRMMRGYCHVCRKSVGVRLDGMVAKHEPPGARNGLMRLVCTGSDLPPGTSRYALAILAEQDAEIARLRAPYPDNPGATHFDGCWRTRGHHNCAVAEVERLRGVFATMAADLASTHNRVEENARLRAEAFDTAEYRRRDAADLFARDEEVERLRAALAKQEAEEVEALDGTVATSDWLGGEADALTAKVATLEADLAVHRGAGVAMGEAIERYEAQAVRLLADLAELRLRLALYEGEPWAGWGRNVAGQAWLGSLTDAAVFAGVDPEDGPYWSGFQGTEDPWVGPFSCTTVTAAKREAERWLAEREEQERRTREGKGGERGR